MTIEEFLNRLDGVKAKRQGWKACCPAHEDRSPSLNINIGEDGRILLHCFSGCSIVEICQSLGLQLRDLFPDSGQTREAVREACLKRAKQKEVLEQQRQVNGLTIDVRRVADQMIHSGQGIDLSEWTTLKLDEALNQLADAYEVLEEERYAESGF